MVRGGRRRVRPDETSFCARALANLMPDRITERVCRNLPQWLQRNSRVVPMAGPQYNFIKVHDGYVMHVQHLLPPLLEEPTPPQKTKLRPPEDRAVETTKTDNLVVETTKTYNHVVETTKTDNRVVETTRTDNRVVETTKTENRALEVTKMENCAAEKPIPIVETVNSKVVDQVLTESVIEKQSNSHSSNSSSSNSSVTQDSRNSIETRGENEVNQLLEEYGLTVFTKDSLFLAGRGLDDDAFVEERAFGDTDAKQGETLTHSDLCSVVETSKDDRFLGVDGSKNIESVLNDVSMCTENLEIESSSNTNGCDKCSESDCECRCRQTSVIDTCSCGGLDEGVSETKAGEEESGCPERNPIEDDEEDETVFGENVENDTNGDLESLSGRSLLDNDKGVVDNDESIVDTPYKSESGSHNGDEDTSFYKRELKPWNVDECIATKECETKESVECTENSYDDSSSTKLGNYKSQTRLVGKGDSECVSGTDGALEGDTGTVSVDSGTKEHDAEDQCDADSSRTVRSPQNCSVSTVQIFSELKRSCEDDDNEEKRHKKRHEGYDNHSFEMWDEEDRAAIMNARRANRELKEKLLHIARLPPLLFFLHGVGGSSCTWSHQLNYFQQKGYEVVAPDLLGHGLSSAPKANRPYKFKHLLRNVFLIFDMFVHPHRRVAIVAHSYGCSFAAALARHRASNVILLILLGSGGPSPLIPSPDIGTGCCLLTSLMNLLKCGCRRETLYVPRGKCFTSSGGLEVPTYVIDAMIRGQDWPEGDAAFHRRVLVPTLLLYGMKDTVITLIEQCEMEKAIPRANLEILPSCGHLLMLESPEQVCAKVHRFLKKWDHISLFSETSLRHRGAT